MTLLQKRRFLGRIQEHMPHTCINNAMSMQAHDFYEKKDCVSACWYMYHTSHTKYAVSNLRGSSLRVAKNPGLQGIHNDPSTGLCRPTGNGRQRDLLSALCTPEYVPAGQAMQACMPAWSPYVPRGHGLHADMSFVSLYIPALHCIPYAILTPVARHGRVARVHGSITSSMLVNKGCMG